MSIAPSPPLADPPLFCKRAAQEGAVHPVSMLGMLLVLVTALVALLRFYPYTYNFPAYPKITHTKSGAEGDPLNLVFVGSKDQITHSFQQAGWLIPDPITLQTSEKIAVDSLTHKSYPTAPVSNLYVFGRVQDLAFEKPTNDVANRGHIRLWKTGTLIGIRTHTRLVLPRRLRFADYDIVAHSEPIWSHFV